MKKQKMLIWYDEEGDYLEILMKKSPDTIFEEIKKDCMKIIDKKSGHIIGYAFLNFTKRKEKSIDMALQIPA